MAHRAPCNTFGEQREIYEWIGLFRGALFFLQGGAIFPSGGRFYLLRGALFGPWKKHSKIQGGLSPPEQKCTARHLEDVEAKEVLIKSMKDTSFIVIETTVLYSYLQIGNVIISHSRLSASRFKNKLSALYNVINGLSASRINSARSIMSSMFSSCPFLSVFFFFLCSCLWTLRSFLALKFFPHCHTFGFRGFSCAWLDS